MDRTQELEESLFHTMIALLFTAPGAALRIEQIKARALDFVDTESNSRKAG